MATLRLVCVLAAIAIPLLPGRAEAQERPTPGFRIGVEGGVSVRDFGGIRIGRDIVAYTLRATRVRPRSFDFWADAGRFFRPDFQCQAGLPCNEDGWLARAGASAIASGEADEPGPRLGLRGGLGATFSDDTRLTYLLGFGLHWRLTPRWTPYAELRWEQLVGINLTMVSIGVDLDL